MANTSQPRVYDLIYPSPVPLKNITAVLVAIQLCRKEIDKYRAANALNRLHFSKISFDNLTSNIPSTILKLIEKCTKEFGSSIENWLEYHFRYIFKLHHTDLNSVLNDFDDFVADHDGKVDYRRTAKRVILCDRFDDIEKFLIACKYCFEEDVLNLWPSVSTSLNTDDFGDSEYSFLRYWIYRLRFENDELESIWGEQLLKEANFEITATIERFWNRIDSSGHVKIAISHFDTFFCASRFCRYVLPKLSEPELDEFMLARGVDLIPSLLEFSVNTCFVLPVWKHVKNKITETGFVHLVRKIFEKQTKYRSFSPDTCGYGEIWRTAPVSLKRPAISDVLQDSSLFVRDAEEYLSYRKTDFLFAVLSDCTIEERSSFWEKNWSNLILGTSTKDLRDLMNLCIADQNEIDKFKSTKLSSYEIIAPCCLQFLNRADFQKLDEFLNICCHEEEMRKNIKLRLLFEDFEMNFLHLIKVGLFEKFIKSTIVDEDRIAEFKNVHSSKLKSKGDLRCGVLVGKYRELMEFVDTMVLSEEVAVDLKECYFPTLIWGFLTKDQPYLHDFRGKELSNFLRWCFADDEKIERFKQTLPIDKIIQCLADEIISKYDANKRKCRNGFIDALIEWYFVTPEAVAEFKASFADVFEKIGQN